MGSRVSRSHWILPMRTTHDHCKKKRPEQISRNKRSGRNRGEKRRFSRSGGRSTGRRSSWDYEQHDCCGRRNHGKSGLAFPHLLGAQLALLPLWAVRNPYPVAYIDSLSKANSSSSILLNQGAHVPSPLSTSHIPCRWHRSNSASASQICKLPMKIQRTPAAHVGLLLEGQLECLLIPWKQITHNVVKVNQIRKHYYIS